MKEAPIDLSRQLKDLISREEMLAFFDFTLRTADGRTVSGLCKLSSPPQGGKSRSITLLAIIDLPDDTDRQGVYDYFKLVDWSSLPEKLSAVDWALAHPAFHVRSQSLIQQVDVAFASVSILNPHFIRDILCPVIVSVMGVDPSPPVLWAKMAVMDEPPQHRDATPPERGGIVEWVKGLFSDSHSGKGGV